MIHRETIAHAEAGVGIDQFTLRDGPTSVKLLSIGAVTRDWRLSCSGQKTPMILGYDDPLKYLENPNYFGVIAGRVANRIAGGRFSLEGNDYQISQNEGENTLHGGHIGLAKRLYHAEVDAKNNAVIFTYHSPHGEEGFPGAVDFTYVISLRGTTLTYDLRATVDRPTPIALAQHNYYNLMGQGDILQHHLQIDSDRYTPTDASLIPTGEISPVTQTRFDFSKGGGIIADVDRALEGIDMNLVLNATPSTTTLRAPNGVRLTLTTDEAGVQLYTGGMIARCAGLEGRENTTFSGLCLEPQQFPNALNEPKFAPAITTPETPYRQVVSVDIAKDNT
jgi:aldose 1-epimerase